MRDDTGLQLDFMGKIDGVKSFEGVRARASTVRFGTGELRVAALQNCD